MNNENIPETDMEAGLFMRHSSDKKYEKREVSHSGKNEMIGCRRSE